MTSLSRSVCLGVLLSLAIGCGLNDPHDKEGEAPAGVIPGPQDTAEFDDLAEKLKIRLLSEFVDKKGYLVSLRDEKPAHVGDALKYTGIALSVLDCDEGQPLLGAILDGIVEMDGLAPRYRPLPDSRYGKTSRDGEVGMLFGLASHWVRCPGSREGIRDTLALHHNYLVRNKFNIEPGELMGEALKFPYLEVMRLLGVSDDRRSAGVWEAGLIATAKGIEWLKDPCYPVDLATLQIILVARLGYEVDPYPLGQFCAATKDMALAHADWLCRRNDGKAFLRGHRLNEYEYQLQICPWQDGTQAANVETHALDWLLMYHLVGGRGWSG